MWGSRKSKVTMSESSTKGIHKKSDFQLTAISSGYTATNYVLPLGAECVTYLFRVAPFGGQNLEHLEAKNFVFIYMLLLSNKCQICKASFLGLWLQQGINSLGLFCNVFMRYVILKSPFWSFAKWGNWIQPNWKTGFKIQEPLSCQQWEMTSQKLGPNFPQS